jgi:hypothetical protein
VTVFAWDICFFKKASESGENWFTRKCSLLWGVMPYSLVEVYWCFGETWWLHLQVEE